MQYEKEKARCSSQGKRLLTNLAFLYISCTRLFTGLSRRNIHEYKHNIASAFMGESLALPNFTPHPAFDPSDNSKFLFL